MKYRPPTEQDSDETDRFNPESIPVVETTKFLRWGTEVERDENLYDTSFIKRHNNHLRKMNKFMPMGNYKDRHQKQIERIRSMRINLMESVELYYDAEEISLNTVEDAQFSRGQEGFYTREMNTTRQKVYEEFENKSVSKKDKRISFFKNKKPEKGENENLDGEIKW